MANPFSKMQEYFTAPHRVTHDCSFVNNLTMDFGKLVPVFYKDVVPGESFRITPTFRMNFQPMVFPVQTNMRAHLHFFYCRTKDVYKDWLDKFGMTKDGLEMPYMKLTEENRDMVNTGELGDYLGIPTVTYGEFGSLRTDYFRNQYYDIESGSYTIYPSSPVNLLGWLGDSTNFYEGSLWENGGYVGIPANGKATNARPQFILPKTPNINDNKFKFYFRHNISGLGDVQSEVQIIPLTADGVAKYGGWSGNLTFKEGVDSELEVENIRIAEASYLIVRFNLLPFSPSSSSYEQIDASLVRSINFSMLLSVDVQTGIENADAELSELPFYSDENPDGERLVNLPFRFYEFIYNSFYRDERNNPYKIDGQVEYNKYLPSTEGGEDTYHYQLRHANWEQDFLTTATASPQFGVAPLVGVTATGTMTFQDDEGNTYTAVAKTGDDNDTITGIEVHSPDMPVGTLRALIDTVSSGISISDFRNVNALQRLLEKRLRHGLKYVDMVQASYGTRPKNLEISMPEFIGGVNEDVIVNRISQTVDTEAVPLGTVGGQAGVLGTSNHPISCYCDDFGCIMGIMYIAPVPNYSQLLPKYWLKSEALDFYHPEFSHIGYQPILNKEVAPLQFFRDDKANGTDKYNSVFGYQRPWYDYISSVDEVHGNFRNNMRRYLINRVFDTPPALTEDFLLVDSNQVNDVFAVTEDSDKIFGEILFRVKRKNAVPTLSIPRLES